MWTTRFDLQDLIFCGFNVLEASQMNTVTDHCIDITGIAPSQQFYELHRAGARTAYIHFTNKHHTVKLPDRM